MFQTEEIAWEIGIIGLTLSIFTLANVISRSYKQKTDTLLCCWLLILNIPLVHAILEHADFKFSLFRLYTNPALTLLQGPLLYCYVFLLIREREKFRPSFLLHLLPSVLFYLLFISASYTQPMLPNPDQTNPPIGSTGEPPLLAAVFTPLMLHFGLLNTLFFLGYSLLTTIALLKHQKKISTFFSQKDNQISLKWIYLLPISFTILVLLNIVNENSIVPSAQINPLILHLLSYLSFIVLLCFFGVKQKPIFPPEKALKQKPAFNLEKAIPKPVPSTETDAEQDQSAGEETPATANNIVISAESISEVTEKMQSYMENEKPYLEPDFSVYNLADALKIPRRTLSHVLNSGLSKNFFQYVNEYRIEEVKNV